jgi:pimeloyl-ACP methyl ester carboxylesterase
MKFVTFLARHGTNKVKYMTEVVVQAGDLPLDGNMVVPDSAKGLVVFVHGSGSSRFSPRNQYVAGVLNGGGLDYPVIEMNRAAAEALQAPCQIEIVEGATHLFEEPGKLEQVAARARDWFLEHSTSDAV